MKLELRYSLLTGLGICAYIIVEYLLGWHTTKVEVGETSGYFAIIIPLITYYLALKEKRDKENNGSLSFSSGFLTETLISFGVAFIIMIFMYFYMSRINPDWMEFGMEYQKMKMIANGTSPEEVEKQISMAKEYFKPSYQLPIVFISTLVEGLAISLVYALILKRKAK